jgi:predicted CXXCH cytochrome family protein
MKIGLKLTTLTIALGVIVIGGALTVAFYAYDFTENNPQFCRSCHLMDTAFEAWKKSVHNGINCHDCHEATIVEKNKMLLKTLFKNPKKVTERYGHFLVSSEICESCHLTSDVTISINRSYGHARHVFMEQLECTQCHGTKLHRFVPEERFCINCHMEKRVHGVGMEGMSCLGCHTYGSQQADLKPSRERCLSCHAKIAQSQGINGTEFWPMEGPMSFRCMVCHKPHSKDVKPSSGDCIGCHNSIEELGKHGLHLEVAGGECTVCHKPHAWRVTKKIAQELCQTCHDYRPLNKFFL